MIDERIRLGDKVITTSSKYEGVVLIRSERLHKGVWYYVSDEAKQYSTWVHSSDVKVVAPCKRAVSKASQLQGIGLGDIVIIPSRNFEGVVITKAEELHKGVRYCIWKERHKHGISVDGSAVKLISKYQRRRRT